MLKVIEEIDWYDTKKDKIIGEHTKIELHKIGDSSLHPTHLLKIYHGKNKEAILLRVEQDKPPRGLKKPKQRGNTFSYYNEKKVSIIDMKIESVK